MSIADLDPATIPAAEDLGRVHLIGIGGAGMSGIARILLDRGVPVSGSDAKESRALVPLRALGARIEVGHDGAHLGDADTVVVSTAIGPRNAELLEAQRRGLRILPRAAALAAVMSGCRGVAVAGTHGKTTTTSMLTVALQHCGVDPSFAIGGQLNEAGSNAHYGTGDIFVAEADESDGSFLLLSPQVAIVTNIEPDHLDHYGTAAAVTAAFEQFVDRLPPGGTLVVCGDDPGSAALASYGRDVGRVVRTYGENGAADVHLSDLRLSGATAAFDLAVDGEPAGRLRLAVPGRHNALNAAAALTAGVALGLPVDALREGLAAYSGVRRRFEAKGTEAGVRVYDDYAHHPTEIEATLRAAREVVGSGRLVVAFQPHRYSRTLAFVEDFGRALGLADEVVVMDVYAAGEEPMPGASGAAVAAAVPLPPAHVVYEPSWSAVAQQVAGRARPGDLVLTMGAGDVTMLGPEILVALGGQPA